MIKDMTKGSPMKLILGFSIPLLFGMLFQQFYNLVDSLIVGRTLGLDAFSAVGSTGSLNFLIIGFCMGVCTGFTIPMSNKFGAGDYSTMRRYMINAVYLTVFFAVIMTLFTVVLCRPILVLTKTPSSLIDDAYRYIVVIFLGIPAICLYNFSSGIIRSLGDSRTPVVFLIISSILNIGLDLFLIMVAKMGVAGAAWATVISQLVSGIGCVIFMWKKFDILKAEKSERTFDWHLVKVLCSMGVPMGLQYSITAIGCVMVQSAVNSLGPGAVAAVSAGGKIGGFFTCPFDALGSTMTTYGGQNMGAGKYSRLTKGLKSAAILGSVYAVVAFVVLIFAGEFLIGLFVSDLSTSVLGMAEKFLVINSAFYIPLVFVNEVRFLIQGMGYSKLAVIAGVCEMVARALVAVALVPVIGFTGACLASPFAWLCADVFLIPAFLTVMKKVKAKAVAT